MTSLFSSLRDSLLSAGAHTSPSPGTGTGDMASNSPEKGDKVSWNWNGNHPSGEVAEKKTEGEVSVTSKRGNTISKSAEPNDPAIALSRSGNDVVKNQSELQVEEKRAKSGTPAKKSTPAPADGDKNGETANGTTKSPGRGRKRAADDDGKGNAGAKKARGRPKGARAIRKPSSRQAKTDAANKATAAKEAAKEAASAPKPKSTGTGKRGRPPGSGAGAKKKSTGGVSKAKATTADGKPRARGRPKGSTNKAGPKKEAKK